MVTVMAWLALKPLSQYKTTPAWKLQAMYCGWQETETLSFEMSVVATLKATEELEHDYTAASQLALNTAEAVAELHTKACTIMKIGKFWLL